MDSIGRFIVLASILCLITIPLVDRAEATDLEEIAKLTASDGAAGDSFGFAVSLSGDSALIGAAFDDDNGSESGSAYVYRFDGTTWVEEQKLTASDAAASDRFGASVSLSGNAALIGADGDDDSGSDSGSAYVYRFNGTTWVEEQKLTASDGYTGDMFGWSVSLEGDVALIGSWRDDDARSDIGSAYVYRFDGTTWVEEQKLRASDGETGDLFGSSVSLAGDVALIAAVGDDDNGIGSGSAYVYRFDGTTWVEEQKLTASNGAVNDGFGISVSANGDVALIGADRFGDNRHGSAYVYRFEGTAWVEGQELTASDGNGYGQFGLSVSLAGDVALIGAPYDNEVGTGSVYVYRFDSTTWVEEQKLTAGDGEFGYSVSLAGDVALIGARSDDDTGSAYVFSEVAGIHRCQGIDGVDTLFVNGDNGTAGDHQVSVSVDGPISFLIQKPGAGGNGKFLVHMNVGAPTSDTITTLPANLGWSCFPLLLSTGADAVCIWNAIGKENKVGSSSYFGTPIEDPGRAPERFIDLIEGDSANLPVGSVWTIQGVIVNPDATSPKLASVTNAIIMTVE